MLRPSASSGDQPKSSAAAGFHSVTISSRSITITAAGLISTREAEYSRCRSTSAKRRAFWIANPDVGRDRCEQARVVLAEPSLLLDALDADHADRLAADEDRHPRYDREACRGSSTRRAALSGSGEAARVSAGSGR